MPSGERVSFATVGVVAGLVLAVGVWGAGAGPRNGDAAVYLFQALAGDWSERRVHLPWLIAATGLVRGWGPVALDVASAFLLAATTVWVGKSVPEAPGRAAAAFAAAAFAAASFAEVEPAWVCAVVVAAFTRFTVVGLALGILVSPTAVLAAPWVATRTGLRPVLFGVGLGVGLATAFSGADWWWGDRGVFTAPLPNIGSCFLRWLMALGPLCLLGVDRGVAASALLLFGPSDADSWLICAVALAGRSGKAPVFRWVVLAGFVWGLVSWHALVRNVRAENAAIASLAASMEPEDGVIAPWSVGVRVSLQVTGEPYGLNWRPPSGFVRDQQARWCSQTPDRIVWWGAAGDPLAQCPHPMDVHPGGSTPR